MVGGNEIRATPVDLDRHASTVDDVAAEVNAAADAAQVVQFDNDAYGQFCQALPAMMAPLKDLVVDALTATVGNLADVADKVRAAAANYRGSDDHAADRFGGRA